MPERAAEKDVIRARTAIGQLLGDKIRLLPTADGYLEAEVIGNYGGLVALTSERPWARGTGALVEEGLVAGACNTLCLLLFATRRIGSR